MSNALFDKSMEYNAMLNQGLRLTGEEKDYFIKGRVLDMKKQLPSDFMPNRILDFGCGIGDTTAFLAEVFPKAKVTGMDTSKKALEYAQNKYGSKQIEFKTLDQAAEIPPVELCYSNGVFHHIDPIHRHEALSKIFHALLSGGYFSFFENNPWNVGTRLVMSRIPFDRDTKMISSHEARNLLRKSGFQIAGEPRFLFYFPKILSCMRWLEKSLAQVPLGAQYYVLATK